jgi:hypothetical protein
MTRKSLDIHANMATGVAVPKLSADEKSAAEEKRKKFFQEEMRMVKGIFQNFETPGAGQSVQVKKYKEHFFKMDMQDGQEYEVPLYVARFLNGIDATAEHINGKLGTCSYPVSSYLMDQAGNPIVHQSKRKRRFGFQSLDFASNNAA